MEITPHEVIYYFLILVAIRFGWKLKEWSMCGKDDVSQGVNSGRFQLVTFFNFIKSVVRQAGNFIRTYIWVG